MKGTTKFLAAIFAVSGVLHFVKPKPYESIVPKPLPMKRELVQVSGAAELACSGLLIHPRTRRLGGRLSMWLLLAVFPANVQMTVSAYQKASTPAWYRLATVARLPLQAPMVAWARRAANGDA
jgi:uncharacterized membrane protein